MNAIQIYQIHVETCHSPSVLMVYVNVAICSGLVKMGLVVCVVKAQLSMRMETHVKQVCTYKGSLY